MQIFIGKVSVPGMDTTSAMYPAKGVCQSQILKKQVPLFLQLVNPKKLNSIRQSVMQQALANLKMWVLCGLLFHLNTS
jgi:hypothetical protein